MDKLISAEKYKAHLKKDFMNLPKMGANTKHVMEIIIQWLMTDIDLIPAEYPIKKVGYWKKDNKKIVCSNCGKAVINNTNLKWFNKNVKFCPCCGAKMEGKK